MSGEQGTVSWELGTGNGELGTARHTPHTHEKKTFSPPPLLAVLLTPYSLLLILESSYSWRASRGYGRVLHLLHPQLQRLAPGLAPGPGPCSWSLVLGPAPWSCSARNPLTVLVLASKPTIALTLSHYHTITLSHHPPSHSIRLSFPSVYSRSLPL